MQRTRSASCVWLGTRLAARPKILTTQRFRGLRIE